MSVKVAIAITALASYELSHECRSRQLPCQPRILGCPIHQLFIDREYRSISNLTVPFSITLTGLMKRCITISACLMQTGHKETRTS
jgi:hypothetical protein